MFSFKRLFYTFLIPSFIHGRKCFCGFDLMFCLENIYCTVEKKLEKPIIRMIDTVKYFNIITCAITQFLLTFLDGLITDFMFQDYFPVLMLTSTVNLVTKSNGKCIEISAFMIDNFILVFII